MTAPVKVESKKPRGQNLVFATGIGGLLFVPMFKSVTHLPPVGGMLISLGALWSLTDRCGALPCVVSMMLAVNPMSQALNYALVRCCLAVCGFFYVFECWPTGVRLYRFVRSSNPMP